MNPAEEAAILHDNARSATNALHALRSNWDSAYHIETDGNEWRARRLDQLGGWMDAASAEELRNQILDDYVNKPVRRQAPQRND